MARSVSSLQKVRLRYGSFEGIIELKNGKLKKEPYFDLQRKVLKAPEDYPGFVFTLGIVSNHGNWFTAENQNKELHVLSQSYDWLLFLTDQGLSKFIKNFILNPSKEMSPVRNAFFSSYTGQSGKNRFTKVNIDVDADRVLRKYFDQNRNKIENWFNVISPSDGTISNLRNDLQSLVRSKNLPKESV